jgi:DNA (cytosine-5)-methyltransferase 1
MEFKLGELFSGPGGLAKGADFARIQKNKEIFSIKHTWANDIDKDSCETYIKNICPKNPEKVIIGPVENLDIKNLPKIDAFAYGFPCNDFSIVGEQNGFSGKFGPLYSYGVEVLNYHNPLWFLAENVGGLHSADEGSTFQFILKELGNAGKGYELSTHLYKFEEYGVPQTRHRIIIVGLRKDLKLKFKIPAPTLPDPEDYMTAQQALMNIPEDAPNNEKTSNSLKVVERLKHIPEGENAWYSGIPENLQLNVKGAKLSQIYRRLDRNKPSYTITGSGGGGTHGYHWEEPRALTNRERARIQTFPDDFIFIGKKESVRKQIGMAVPPLGAKIIIESILKTFAKIEYKSVKPKWDY